MMTPAAALVVSDGQREALEVIAKSQTAPFRQVQRARVLLLAADGVANARIADQVGISVTTARAWRSRFAEEGLAKLGKVRAGRGRKSTIPQAKIDEIVELTQHCKPAGQTHWSCRTMAARVGVSAATVQRVWAARALKPHRAVTGWSPVISATVMLASTSWRSSGRAGGRGVSARPTKPNSSRPTAVPSIASVSPSIAETIDGSTRRRATARTRSPSSARAWTRASA